MLDIRFADRKSRIIPRVVVQYPAHSQIFRCSRSLWIVDAIFVHTEKCSLCLRGEFLEEQAEGSCERCGGFYIPSPRHRRPTIAPACHQHILNSFPLRNGYGIDRIAVVHRPQPLRRRDIVSLHERHEFVPHHHILTLRRPGEVRSSSPCHLKRSARSRSQRFKEAPELRRKGLEEPLVIRFSPSSNIVRRQPQLPHLRIEREHVFLVSER